MHTVKARATLLLILALLVLGIAGAPACVADVTDESYEDPTAIESEPITSAEAAAEWDFFARTNHARLNHGLHRLHMSKRLRAVARDWSTHLQRQQRLEHNPRLQSIIDGFAPHWTRWGENVGVGGSVRSIQGAFMDSPPHRANILGHFRYVGIGVAIGGRGRIWVTVDFLKTTDNLVVVTPP